MGQSCWKHIFDIQQPCSKLAVERKGFKPRAPHLRCKDVARVLILDEGREPRIQAGHQHTLPQPGRQFESGQGLGGIPAQAHDQEVFIKGDGLFDKVMEWLSVRNNINVVDLPGHLFAAVNDLDGGRPQHRYYLGWFRVGFSETHAACRGLPPHSPLLATHPQSRACTADGNLCESD